MLRSGFAAAFRGSLPQAEPPAVLYKAQWLDRWRDEGLDPQAEESCSGHGELHSHSPPPSLHPTNWLSYSCPPLTIPQLPPEKALLSALEFSLLPYWTKVLSFPHPRSGALKWLQSGSLYLRAPCFFPAVSESALSESSEERRIGV